MTNQVFLIFLALNLLFVSCSKDDEAFDPNKKQFGIFKVLDDKTTVEMNGVIGSASLSNFNNLLKAYPNIKKINIKNGPGSKDDEINLKLSLKVHQKGINIHLLDNTEIASGAVDFFLAGVKRTRGKNTKIGVHSWGTDQEKATDFPKGHKYHLPYINYYTNVGFTQKQAEDFYYFTIYAASPDGIHWMTEQEIVKYNMLSE